MNYTMKEISKKTGLTESVIRNYTDKGIIPCRRDEKNHRIFDDKVIKYLEELKCLKQCGASIEDLKTYSDLCLLDDQDSLRKRYEFMIKQKEQALKKVKEAKDLLSIMEHKVHHYEDIIAGNTPDDTSRAAKKLSLCQ